MNIKQIKDYFSHSDYMRGLEYYESGRVGELCIANTYSGKAVYCHVRGHKTYHVEFECTPKKINYDFMSCTCPRYDDEGACKHLAAAMIKYVYEEEQQEQTDSPKKQSNSAAQSDVFAKQMLGAYLKKVRMQSAPIQKSAKLVPRINSMMPGDYPSFSFRVGYEKLYVVKNVYHFLNYVDKKVTVMYGKELTLDHSLDCFNEKSQQLILLLMNEYSTFKSIYKSYSYNYDYYNSYEKNAITLTGDSFDRWFDLLSVDIYELGNTFAIQFIKEDPQIRLQLSKKKGAVALEITMEEDYSFFGSTRTLYAAVNNKILRCSDDFREKVYPLLSSRKTSMQISFDDMPTFCSCVLPEIEDLVEIDDLQGLLQNYLPDECNVRFYFDIKDEILLLNIVFAYGLECFSLSQKTDGCLARRNTKQETEIVCFAENFFERKDDQFTLSDENAIYDFLTDSIDMFREKGDVYLSDRLDGRRFRAAPISIGLSVSDGLLSLELDTGGFPPEELSNLYQSMLLRRKYHRLADGRYVALDGSSCEKLAEITKMLQLSERDLKKGAVTLPANRALYLDAVLSENDNIQINRDAQFRAIVRNFKALAESDYILPQEIHATLRPYQKIGYQWLKTLDGYGFGGILADEMGLGKTLQIISYLATVKRKDVGAASLVVCPASLIYNWGDEMQKFAPELKYCLILGTTAERDKLRADAGSADVWVTSYELLRQDIKKYSDIKFYCCILDEAQHIKNASTLASKAVKTIQCTQRFVLTGTPIENRLSELWNLFDFLMPGYLYTNHAFREKLEKPIIKSKNPEAVNQLRRLVQPFLLKRKKADVLKELPPKQEYIRRISMSEDEQKLYYANVQAAVSNLGDKSGQGKLQILAALMRLRQLCCDPNLCYENYEGPTSKLDACIELCASMVENGHQILLFSQFTSMLERLKSRLDALHISNFTLQGSTSKEQRASLVKSFNAGGASVFLISLKAGGTGLNLTAADVVIHFDPWWNQAAQDQATDRAHRIGQSSRVQVYKLITTNTIEEKIMVLQEKKIALLDTISGCEDAGIINMSSEELLDLLKI